jgi:hypothetical protein
MGKNKKSVKVWMPKSWIAWEVLRWSFRILGFLIFAYWMFVAFVIFKDPDRWNIIGFLSIDTIFILLWVRLFFSTFNVKIKNFVPKLIIWWALYTITLIVCLFVIFFM